MKEPGGEDVRKDLGIRIRGKKYMTYSTESTKGMLTRDDGDRKE